MKKGKLITIETAKLVLIAAIVMLWQFYSSTMSERVNPALFDAMVYVIVLAVFLLVNWLIIKQKIYLNWNFHFQQNKGIIAFVMTFALIEIIGLFINNWNDFVPSGAVTAVGAGIIEEFIFRGLVLLILLKIMLTILPTHRLFDCYVAVVGSAALFSVSHLVNSLDGSTLISTVYQMMGALGIGMVFAVIYLRLKNIMITMFLHFMIDFIGPSFFTPSLAHDTLILVVSIIAVLVFLRRSKVNGITDNIN